MLGLMVKAVRKHGPPDALYLDNGSTYRGQALSLACASQLGTALRHAGFVPSPHHAEPIPGENRPFADQTNGVHYFDNLVVLKTATQPALLLEAGVIVHRAEELAVQQPARREAMATAIASALDVCLRRKPLAAPAPGDAR